jgi:Threonine aldolase
MANATFGDDVYQEDKMTTDFQTEVARLTGMEDALFMLSGTYGESDWCSCPSISTAAFRAL